MSTGGTLTFLVRQGRQPRLVRDMPSKAAKPTFGHVKEFSVQVSVYEKSANNPESVKSY